MAPAGVASRGAGRKPAPRPALELHHDQIYAGRPLTEIARHAGTSVAMIDRHYAGVIANWDGNAVPAERQIQLARQAAGRSVDVGGPGSGRSGS